MVSMTKYAVCPECGGILNLADDVIAGEVVPCPDCGSDILIESIEGEDVVVKKVQLSGEDWGE